MPDETNITDIQVFDNQFYRKEYYWELKNSEEFTYSSSKLRKISRFLI